MPEAIQKGVIERYEYYGLKDGLKGITLPDIIQKEVIDRYELKNTMVIQRYMTDDKKKEFPIAKLYGLADTGLDSSDDRDVDGGAANILSSPRDLAKLFQQIVRDPILKPMQEYSGESGPNHFGHGLVVNWDYFGKLWVGHAGAAGAGAIAAYVMAAESGEALALTSACVLNIELGTLATKLGIPEDDQRKIILPAIKLGIEEALRKHGITSFNPKDVTPEHFKGFNANAVWVKLKEEVEQALTQPNSPNIPTPDIDPQSDKIDVVSGQIRTKANEPGTDKTQRQ